MLAKILTMLATVCVVATVDAADEPLGTKPTPQGRELFEFAGRQALGKWQIVNDGVMGGRSSSRVEQGPDGTMNFSGVLSLANNGGFASTRSRGSNLGLHQGDTVVLEVKVTGGSTHSTLMCRVAVWPSLTAPSSRQRKVSGLKSAYRSTNWLRPHSAELSGVPHSIRRKSIPSGFYLVTKRLAASNC